jgi:hypothetical protein
VNPVRAWLAALTPEIEVQAARARDIAASLKALRGDLRSIGRDVEALAARAGAVSRQMAQVRQLQQGRREASVALDALATLMDVHRVGAHVRAAVERAARVDHPVPHLTMERLWPADVYAGLITAIPDPVFFDGPADGVQTLRVPPRLAPVASIAAWTFVAEIVETVVVPAIAARAGDLAGEALDMGPGRLVRRPAGSSAAPPIKVPHRALLVIELGAYGGDGQANSAVALFRPFTSDASPAHTAGARCTYEVWLGAEPA